MRPDAEFEAVQQLIRAGLNDCEISRGTKIPRGTIRDWRHQRNRDQRDSRARVREGPRYGFTECPFCHDADLDRPWYSYLLGLYLGDGCISTMKPGVFRLRIVLDERYPAIIDECCMAIVQMRDDGRRGPLRSQHVGCIEVSSYSKHWPCLFPQHDVGRKHLRPIVLAWWQREIVQEFPAQLLRGLIQSDGCRDLNHINGKNYPRYQFTNESDDIRSIFIDACGEMGIHWTTPTYRTVSVSRRPDVELLDSFVGAKSDPAPWPV